jgi:hypothetical protein
MPATPLTAREIYDTAPLGSFVRFFDGTPEPPARHRRKRAAWLSSNGAGRLVRKYPADHVIGPSFALHVGSYASADITILETYSVFDMTFPLSYAIVERPHPGQAAILQDERGIVALIRLADSAEDAERWLTAHPQPGARIVPAGTPDPRAFTYLQDPGHGWLIVTRADLAAAGIAPGEFSICSYVSGDKLALEEDCDMPLFLKRLDEHGIAWRVRERHINADACVRRWASNAPGEARPPDPPAHA